MSNQWSENEISNVINMYGTCSFQFMASALSKSETSIKTKVISLQKDGILPEINKWTLNESLFLCDTFRIYSLDELTEALPHPRWAIEKRLSIITSSDQKQSGRPISAPEDSFIYENIHALGIKELAVHLNRPDTDIKYFIEKEIHLDKIHLDINELKSTF